MSDPTISIEKFKVLDGPFDLASIHNFGGFEGEEALELFEEVLEIFIEDLPVRTQGMQQALSSTDLETLSREAHSLKGSGRNTCAKRLGDLCEELEKIVKNDFNPAQAGEKINEITSECESIAEVFMKFSD